MSKSKHYYSLLYSTPPDGLQAQRLSRWRARLEPKDEVPRLIEVHVQPERQREQVAPFIVEVASARLTVPPVFDADALAALVGVLRC